jgi:hypothetical protein
MQKQPTRIFHVSSVMSAENLVALEVWDGRDNRVGRNNSSGGSASNVKSTGTFHSTGDANSGFVRVVNAMDTDERYQIQVRLQKLYHRLDTINNKIYNQSHVSNSVWSDDEGDKDQYATGDGELPIQTSLGANERKKVSFRNNVNNTRTMDRVVEEGNDHDTSMELLR